MYLFSVKYLLGFSVEGSLLARDLESSDNNECKSAAQSFMEMNISPVVTQNIFNEFSRSLNYMAGVRKGFYCILCDAATQS